VFGGDWGVFTEDGDGDDFDKPELVVGGEGQQTEESETCTW
jgi:hypothetical protein